MIKTIIAVAASGTLLLTGCVAPATDAPGVAYRVITARRADVEQVTKYPAAIRGRQDVAIYAQVSGKITAVAVAEGDRVRRGQRLFVIDPVPYRAALGTAEATLAAARAAEADARLTLDGKRALRRDSVISQYELSRAENALLSAEAAVALAEAQVTSARNDLSYTTVCAPSDGVVGTIPYRVGALVGPDAAAPLTTVSDNGEMYVYFSLPEARVLALSRQCGAAAGDLADRMPAAWLYLADGSRYEAEGRIESVSGVIDEATGSVQVRAVFPNVGGLLRSGGAGNVGLVERTEGAVVIPQSATYELQDHVYVYRVVAGRTRSTRVSVCAVDAARQYIVTDGLTAGDSIVAEGVNMLSDGIGIRVKGSDNMRGASGDADGLMTR